MKKFFTSVPLQVSLEGYRYEACDNEKLAADRRTAFPITLAVEGFTEPGEEAEVIAACSPDAARNLPALRAELDRIAREKGITVSVREVRAGESQEVSAQTDLFLALIGCAAAGDALFADMTFGTKPQSQAVLLAVQYAYRVLENTTLDCIVYGEIVRPEREKETWFGRVYDMTALVQLDEVTRLLAERRVQNPAGLLRSLLG